ncbi:GMC family oxidoreductase N-terminal domain-containing protein [Sphingomonas immobilis]|uniref:GMC family oxidoreductase N-terminal domain-containing protein n=1 Tax=Sphingomonas immobilis TaxID=3063997 RepID=A0ABT9A406_9SPHN|nr:GMC family oxidoreductase N-terminal domain-containing protein [Sphingomonas sp. CA1-15]MDO7844571.1 GMC family oxidoreductase N-terminal domain-containing protein [Sphingomonas sp. CA1-15]
MGKPFNFLQAAILKSLSKALFHKVDIKLTHDQIVANVQYQFGLIPGDTPRTIGFTLYAVCLALWGPLFLLLPASFGAWRLRVLSRSQVDILQDIARIRGIVYAGYYGHWQGETQDDNLDNPVLNAIGFTLPAHRVRGPGEVKIDYFPGRDLSHSDLVPHDAIPSEVDVIVIGSGAGGAVAAANLTAHGHEVLIVEAGALWNSHDLSHEERRMTSKLFVDGALQNTVDHDVIVFQGRCVGGSTVINNGIALRVNQPGMTHPDAVDVFARWASLGAPVDVARFHHAYDKVSERLSIHPIDPKSGRNNGPHLLNGWAAHAAATGDPRDLAAPAKWFSKNYGPDSIGANCAYCGYCNTGCPYGRKQGMAQSFLIDAHQGGAKILAETKADAILWRDDCDEDGKRIADGVTVTLPDGSHRIIRARKGVVVAAGTLASSRVLQKSGFGQSGTNISLNIACPVVALMPTELRVWDEDQMATYVDCGDFLLESHFQPPMSMSTLMPGWIEDHARRMLNYNRLASAGILFPADRRGHMENGNLNLTLRSDVELPLLRRALATLTKVHFAAGALEVYPALLPGQTLYPGDDIDAFFATAIREADDVTLSSSHPHGGNARNADPAKGVVDLDCRVHGTTNVLVTDASTFTSCIRVNAQLTTMAMAYYATEADPF